MNNKLASTNFHNFLLSVLAGICIGIGGLVFLSVGGPIGAALFAFGLSCVIIFKLKLFTGMAGLVETNKQSFQNLFIALIGNILGCFLAAKWIAYYSVLPITDSVLAIAEARYKAGPMGCFALAMGCGFIVDMSVRSAKENKWIVLVLGIPTFILCGFPHSIADAFYIFCLPGSYIQINWMIVLLNYICVVIGNFVGCNFYRLFTMFAQADK